MFTSVYWVRQYSRFREAHPVDLRIKRVKLALIKSEKVSSSPFLLCSHYQLLHNDAGRIYCS